MISKQLFVFTQVYPFGVGETFLENEAPFWDSFDVVYVCPLALKENDRKAQRNIKSKNAVLIDLHYTAQSRNDYVSSVVATVCSNGFRRDIKRMLSAQTFNKANIKRLLSLSIHTRRQVKLLKQWLHTNSVRVSENAVFYGYWLYEPAMAAVLMKESFPTAKTLCRTHGFDLYEFRHGGYLPYRYWFLSKIDVVAAISEDGYRYLLNQYPEFANKVVVSRLGAVDYGSQSRQQDDVFRIISCSNCISIKRVDKIIETLAHMTGCGVHIQWTHFGDGILLESLKDIAAQKLTEDVEYAFAGRIDNTNLMSNYRDSHYDVFVNVSESEGIPVSIMEAMSFGIPAIATDVGGTRELVLNGKTGYLLSSDFSTNELKELILKIARMNDEQRMSLRQNAREHWANYFSTTKNYTEFMKLLDP